MSSVDVTHDSAIAASKLAGCDEAALAAFGRFVDFYRDFFCRPNPLANARCRDSYKQYVPEYVGKYFGPKVEGLNGGHLKWLRRLAPILALPRESTIADIGGGYGFDSIFLASLGYEVVFYEMTPHHVAICEYLADEWQSKFGAFSLRTVMRSKLGDADEQARVNAEAIGQVDAALLDEVAHHVEPVDGLFQLCATIVRPGGRLFLLEPNYWSFLVQLFFFRVRGFSVVERRIDEDTGEPYLYGNENIRSPSTWTALAAAAGFRLARQNHVVPFGMNDAESLASMWRRTAEQLPVIRNLASTHITFEFMRGSTPASVRS